ncbi:Hypothetical protein, putative, partial [Bodo saltans]
MNLHPSYIRHHFVSVLRRICINLFMLVMLAEMSPGSIVVPDPLYHSVEIVEQLHGLVLVRATRETNKGVVCVAHNDTQCTDVARLLCASGNGECVHPHQAHLDEQFYAALHTVDCSHVPNFLGGCVATVSFTATGCPMHQEVLRVNCTREVAHRGGIGTLGVSGSDIIVVFRNSTSVNAIARNLAVTLSVSLNRFSLVQFHQYAAFYYAQLTFTEVGSVQRKFAGLDDSSGDLFTTTEAEPTEPITTSDDTDTGSGGVGVTTDAPFTNGTSAEANANNTTALSTSTEIPTTTTMAEETTDKPTDPSVLTTTTELMIPTSTTVAPATSTANPTTFSSLTTTAMPTDNVPVTTTVAPNPTATTEELTSGPPLTLSATSTTSVTTSSTVPTTASPHQSTTMPTFPDTTSPSTTTSPTSQHTTLVPTTTTSSPPPSTSPPHQTNDALYADALLQLLAVLPQSVLLNFGIFELRFGDGVSRCDQDDRMLAAGNSTLQCLEGPAAVNATYPPWFATKLSIAAGGGGGGGSGVLGTVCGDGWSDDHATLACKSVVLPPDSSIQYPRGFIIRMFDDSRENQWPILAFSTQTTNRTSIVQLSGCLSKQNNCTHSDDSGVLCSQSPYRNHLDSLRFFMAVEADAPPIMTSLPLLIPSALGRINATTIPTTNPNTPFGPLRFLNATNITLMAMEFTSTCDDAAPSRSELEAMLLHVNLDGLNFLRIVDINISEHTLAHPDCPKSSSMTRTSSPSFDTESAPPLTHSVT